MKTSALVMMAIYSLSIIGCNKAQEVHDSFVSRDPVFHKKSQDYSSRAFTIYITAGGKQFTYDEFSNYFANNHPTQTLASILADRLGNTPSEIVAKRDLQRLDDEF